GSRGRGPACPPSGRARAGSRNPAAGVVRRKDTQQPLRGRDSSRSTSQRESNMRRAWLLTAMAGVGLCALGLAWTSFSGVRAAAKEEKEAKSASLPIGQVVLYSSGVGYFQRE